MAALGIWMWSSPYRYETTQAHRLDLPLDLIPLQCTNTTLFGSSIPLTSTPLKRTSLIFYSVFLAPCLNLIVPAGFFLLIFMRYGESHAMSESTGRTENQDKDKDINLPPPTTSSIVNTRVKAMIVPVAHMIRNVIQIIRAAWPILTGLSTLLLINIVFIVDIETTINRAIPYQDANDESQWTFGQTLALLLLVLPMRDVFDYIKESREVERAAQCTADLKDAVKHQDLDSLRRAVKYADDVNIHINGMYV
jgi:predicted RND superfamily exporter protein